MDCMGAGMLPAGAPTCFVLSSASLAIQQTAIIKPRIHFHCHCSRSQRHAAEREAMRRSVLPRPVAQRYPTWLRWLSFGTPTLRPTTPSFTPPRCAGWPCLRTLRAWRREGTTCRRVGRGPAAGECMLLVVPPHRWLAVTAPGRGVHVCGGAATQLAYVGSCLQPCGTMRLAGMCPNTT